MKLTTWNNLADLKAKRDRILASGKDPKRALAELDRLETQINEATDKAVAETEGRRIILATR